MKKMESIEELMKILKDSNLSELSYEFEDMKINLKANVKTNASKKNIKKEKVKKIEEKQDKNHKDILSEHIGRFNAKVKVGDEIKEGQELATVLAVGVSMPVVSKLKGKIEEIYVEDGGVVDYGKPLFSVKI